MPKSVYSKANFKDIREEMIESFYTKNLQEKLRKKKITKDNALEAKDWMELEMEKNLGFKVTVLFIWYNSFSQFAKQVKFEFKNNDGKIIWIKDYL